MRLLPFASTPALALAAALAALAAAASPAAAADPFLAVPFESIKDRLEGQGAFSVGPRGLELPLDGNAVLVLPIAAEQLELDLEATGPVVLTWASRAPGGRFRPFGPPWRHLTVPRERRTVTLDLRITEGWGVQSRPALGFTGIGHVTVHGLRATPVPRDRDQAIEDQDGALRWAPESPGHTTINFLTPAFWTASTGLWLSDAVALVAAVAFGVAVAVSWFRRRRLGLARALAAAALVAAGLWDAHLLLRLLPAFRLRPTVDVEARIRDGYDFAPDVGALASLARATLRPDERVGVVGAPANWFAPQTICFNLAPRPCVLMTSGSPQPEYRGISGVGVLRADALDAVVVYRAGAVPDGFTRVAALGDGAVIARRRP